MRERFWRSCRQGMLLFVVFGGLALLATGCGDDDDDTAIPTTTAAAAEASFCGVQPRFAEELNMALASADPDARQYEVMGAILEELEPVLQQLRDAEPAELDGVVEEWLSNTEKYAETGEEGLEAAEAARGRMSRWVTEHC